VRVYVFPCGRESFSGLTQDLRPGLLSAAPPGLGFGSNAPKLVQKRVFAEILSSPLAGSNLRKLLLVGRIYLLKTWHVYPIHTAIIEVVGCL
jgi:hypothetical protein